jgi:flavin reductase (DIM6/NTAB) family NADH-FMN oxidoreductase RutF
MDPARFRQLMGTFPTGVAVLTARDANGQPAGMTASAIASVSLEPPLLLVCVGHEAEFHAVLAAATHFGLSVLGERQEEISRRFADRGPDKFSGVSWQPHATDVPLLDGAASHVVCAVRTSVPAGDHTIFLGEVVDGAVFDAAPLLHVHGTYRRLQ